MLLLLQKRQDLFLGHADGFIGNPVDKVFDTQFLAALIDLVCKLLLQVFGHPHEPHDPAFTVEEFFRADIVLAVTDEARRHCAAAD